LTPPVGFGGGCDWTTSPSPSWTDHWWTVLLLNGFGWGRDRAASSLKDRASPEVVLGCILPSWSLLHWYSSS
jgi:hypothetical protein